MDPTTADETLNGVLRSVINEFLHGDFEMIRVFVSESKNRFTSQIHRLVGVESVLYPQLR